MPFKKGQSGNPGGRSPRRDDERRVQLLARKHTDRAIARLAALIDAEDGRIAAVASAAILDRGWGRPSQYIDKHVTYHKRLRYADRIQAPASVPPPAEAVGHTVQ